MKSFTIKHPLKALIVFCLITATASLSLASQTEPSTHPKAKDDIQKILIQQVEPLQSSVDRRYPGIIKASQQTQLAFRIGGPLVAIDVEPGEEVHKGQRLMQVDPRDFKDRIAVLNAQLAAARSDLEHSKQDYDRAVTLFKQQVNAKADYDRAKSAYDRAVAMEQSLKAELQIAHHQLEDTTLKAPYDGMVIEQMVENYEMIEPGQVVIAIQDIATLEVEIHLPENEIVKYTLAKDLPAEVRFTSAPDQRFTIYLKEWTARADEVTRTYTLTFRFTPPAGCQILPGMTADVYWKSPPEGCKTQLIIPTDAVFSTTGHDTYVWVYDDATSQVLKRAVEIGSLTGQNQVQLLSGLNENEWIVMAGSDKLAEGMQVEARTEKLERM
nr:efflux RND transporter periplasmic adaptor subunit [uncultured Desulfuromonas sp.]